MDVHFMGEQDEEVTVCHFDPVFVVVVRTDDGERRLAIHSPSKTFVDEEPIGKKYRFIIGKSKSGLLLEKTERVKP